MFITAYQPLLGHLIPKAVFPFSTKYDFQVTYLIIIGLVWFLCLMAYQLFVGYLMPKPSS